MINRAAVERDMNMRVMTGPVEHFRIGAIGPETGVRIDSHPIVIVDDAGLEEDLSPALNDVEGGFDRGATLAGGTMPAGEFAAVDQIADLRDVTFLQ